MTNLSPKEKDLLQRIDEKEELQPLFFRKVKGLKWFDELVKRDYFNPEKNPRPVISEEEGTVYIPYWPSVEYLVKTAPELSNNIEYAKIFYKMLVDITNYAKEKGFSNYQTWWQFSEIIAQIPIEVIDIDSVNIVDYWLDDKYERGLVAEEIGCKWLPKLLKDNDSHSLQIAAKLLNILFKLVFVEKKYGESVKRELTIRFDNYHAQKIIDSTVYEAGAKCGPAVLQSFHSQITLILDELGNDLWSAIWQPAIEEHEQNKYKSATKNIMVKAYRESLNGYIRTTPDEAEKYVETMLNDKYQTIHRIAIYAISRSNYLYSKLIDELLKEKYFSDNYRHEMWHMLKINYQQFSLAQKQRILDLICGITKKDDYGKILESSTAYNKARWLSAIKDYGEIEAKLYKENVEIIKGEPDHPDFSSYMSSGRVINKSPISIDDMQALSIEDLADLLKNYKSLKYSSQFNTGGLTETNVEGLANTFKQLIKTSPLKFYNQLLKFKELDLAFIYEIIDAYSEIWIEKEQLPWNDTWAFLMDFCLSVIRAENFWDKENTNPRNHFIANRYSVVSAIGRLLEAGAKSDDHAFSEELIPNAENILNILLTKEEGSKYEISSDAVSISINSPRGRCIEALINLTLRSCRLSDNKNNNDHSKVWSHFQPIYDAELARADRDNPEYEFATLVTNYLPNFLYMSKNWVLNNLTKIFNKNNYLKWVCALQGYSYVGDVYEEIYKYLKDNGDFIKALDDQNLDKKIINRIIENIIIAYINDIEKLSDENSLIALLITKNNYDELCHLIWFMWSHGKKDDMQIKIKVLELWSRIIENINLETNTGKKLASHLCHWISFIEKVDDKNRPLLMFIAPYAEVEYNAYRFIEGIANISKMQPHEAYILWLKLLEGKHYDYPEEAVQESLFNIFKSGLDGERKAKEIVSEYLKNNNERPATLLRKIRES